MRIHALINYSLVDLGTIEHWAKKNGHPVTTTAVYENQQFPELDEFDLLIILGGIVSAYEDEKHPWITAEKRFIKKAIEAEKAVLGICLGAQLIAEAIGGKAHPHQHLELGWWDVQFSESIKDIPLFNGLSTEMKLFQYHRDTYELPAEAINLGQSESCENQAFIYRGHVVGLQFHPEFSEAKIQEMVKVHGDEMKEGPYAQAPEEFLGNEEQVEEVTNYLFRLLDNFVEAFEEDGKVREVGV